MEFFQNFSHFLFQQVAVVALFEVGLEQIFDRIVMVGRELFVQLLLEALGKVILERDVVLFALYFDGELAQQSILRDFRSF